MKQVEARTWWASGATLVLLLTLAGALVPGAVPSARGQQATDPMADLGALEPADGKWLVDERDGREYFIKKFKKVEGTYEWANEKQIRYKHWYLFDVERQDADYFYLRIYRVGEQAPPPSPEALARAEAEALAKVAATYEVTTPESDRLQLKPFSRGLPNNGQWRNGFDIADINADGHPDIVHGPPRKGSPRPLVFLGDGQGNWTLWREVQFPREPYDYGDVAVADFNGDGRLDLAFGFHLRGLLAMIQDRPGHFTTWSQGLDLDLPGKGGDASGFSSRAIDVADWDGDGRPDILAVGEGPRPPAQGGSGGYRSSYSFGRAIYLNQGDGTWRRVDKGLSRGETFGDSLTVADFTGDGRKDLVTASLKLNSKEILFLNQPDASWEARDIDAIRPWAFVQSVTSADFDGDGRTDLVVGYSSWERKIWRTGVDLLLNRGDDGWERHTLGVSESRIGVWTMDSGDVDGDGNVDVVGLDGQGELWIFLGDGHGGFTHEAAAEAAPPSPGCRGYHVQVADLDGDGSGEIVASYAGEGSQLPVPELRAVCPSRGGMTAWKVANQAPAAAASEEAP